MFSDGWLWLCWGSRVKPLFPAHEASVPRTGDPLVRCLVLGNEWGAPLALSLLRLTQLTPSDRVSLRRPYLSQMGFATQQTPRRRPGRVSFVLEGVLGLPVGRDGGRSRRSAACWVLSALSPKGARGTGVRSYSQPFPF